ncbi:MAG: sensor histidine kinase [Sphingobacteriaceae bacterium]
MEPVKPFYRNNFSLAIIFFILITVSFILAVFLAYSFNKKYVETEFSSKKIEVFEEIIKPYNDFFQNNIPEISYYQGYLDSASAQKYAGIVTHKYPFVDRVVFYDTEISNHLISDGFRAAHISIGPKAVYQFGPDVDKDSMVLFKSSNPNTLSLKTADEFNKMAIKFSSFIEALDTTQALSNDQIINTFYTLSPNRITYLNIPRREELSIFKDLMMHQKAPSPVFQKDMFSFYLNPAHFRLPNTHPELYQRIQIVPLVYETLTELDEQMSTEIALSGPFSNFKLYLSSSPAFLQTEINRRFLPIAGVLLLIYGFLAAIAYLIYQNLNINRRMFKLQYDFINNFTHEFKTPVSVIKVAGNNISGSADLTERERKHYGRILDEEADKLNDLMNKLLSFTQIENKSIKLQEELIDLNHFCQKRVDAYHINKPDFLITYEIIGVSHFKTDPVLLSSLFNNLMDNAYKYSYAHRRELHIEISKSGNKLLFKFKDQGIGIAKSDLSHIFKKFYRIESEYNQQGSVGLGLAFCQQLVNFMKGDISVASEPGNGTEFTIELPYQI